MFNWDDDYETLVAEKKVILRSVPATDATRQSKRERVRDFARRAALPGVVAVALAAVAAGVQFLPASNNGTVFASIAQLPALVFGGGDAVMPEALQAYDQSQYDHFRRGIVGFSDADLLEYARSTQASLHGADAVMGGFLMDALFLAEREIDRRGLPRPLAG